MNHLPPNIAALLAAKLAARKKIRDNNNRCSQCGRTATLKASGFFICEDPVCHKDNW